MYPVLVKIPLLGGITITTYGALVAFAFVAGMLWVGREAKRMDEDPEKAVDLVFYIILAAILGSRLFYVLVSERDRFFGNPLMFFRIWEGGLTFYGGLIASVAVSAWYARKHKLSLLVYSDIFAPGIALGHAIGRIGCFLVGCCYGRPTGGATWFSVTFPKVPETFAPPGIPLYPTQLMEGAGEFLIFSVLFLMRKKKRFNGQVLATYFILYSILRAVCEYFRGDAVRGYMIEPWLTTSQFVSGIIFIMGLAMYVRYWPRKNQ